MDYTDFLLLCGIVMFAYQIHVLCEEESSTFRVKGYDVDYCPIATVLKEFFRQSAQRIFQTQAQNKSFPNVTLVYGLNVTCDMKRHKPGSFPSQTWTCTDMRVNGSRMAYGYYPNFIGVTNKCTETRGFDELAEVCRAMMRGIDVTKELWVAYASNAKCEFIDEMRLMLNMTLNMTKTGYRWDVMKAGYGWMETLQCMAIR